MNKFVNGQQSTCIGRQFGGACQFLGILLAVLLVNVCSTRAYAAKNKVNKSARTLTINSEPSGARVEFNGQYVGDTPLVLTYDKSFFEGHGMWLWSRYLDQGVSMVVSDEGCAPQTMDITGGPYDWQNGFGAVVAQYYVFTSAEFNLHLNCSGSTSGLQQRFGTAESSSYAQPNSPGRVAGPVTLQIQSSQGSLIDDAQKVAVVYCLSHRLMLTQASSTMDLEVQVGDRTVSFRQNGSRAVQLEAADQTYSISGKISIGFGARDLRGNQSAINLTYDFTGDGTINLSEADAGRTIPFSLTQVNSRITGIDLSSGQGETEIALSLKRQ
jgi:PEGA domain-containing protein